MGANLSNFTVGTYACMTMLEYSVGVFQSLKVNFIGLSLYYQMFFAQITMLITK